MILLLLVSIIGGSWWLYRSDALRVQIVTVEGTQALNQQDIQRLINLEKQSMFTVSTAEAAQKLKGLPLIKQVSISRQWPQTVAVKIVERQPVAYWRVGNNDSTVDEEGVVLKGAMAPWGAPTIIYLGPATPLKSGDHVDADAVRLALRLVEAVPQTVGEQPFAFQYSPYDGLILVTESGYTVTLGDSQDLKWKLDVWAALLRHAKQADKKVSQLDLRFGTNPALR